VSVRNVKDLEREMHSRVGRLGLLSFPPLLFVYS